MTRYSSDEYDLNGILKNGFDYDLQLWVKDYIIQNCGHKEHLPCDCAGRTLKGQDARDLGLKRGRYSMVDGVLKLNEKR